MLSKPALMLLGLINQKPLNAYEIKKMLTSLNMRWWYNIADSTLYAAIKGLETKGYVSGKVEKNGNMPEKTVYSVTPAGLRALKDNLRSAILVFDYDATGFSIAAFFMDVLEPAERVDLLQRRVEYLDRYAEGIRRQIESMEAEHAHKAHILNVSRMEALALAEQVSARRLLAYYAER